MIELHYYPGNANLAPHFILQDVGADYRLIPVDRSANAQKSEEYLKMNPFGRIPVMVDGGLVLYESAAICLHLVDTHPQSGLAPASGTPERAHFYKWLMFLTDTIQPDVLMYYYPERYTDGGDPETVKRAAENRLTGFFRTIDRHLAENGPCLLGDAFSAADYYLLMVSRWGRPLKTPPGSMAALKAALDATARRGAVERAFAAEGIEPPYF